MRTKGLVREDDSHFSVSDCYALLTAGTKIEAVEPGQLGRVSLTVISFAETRMQGKTPLSWRSPAHRHSARIGI